MIIFSITQVFLVRHLVAFLTPATTTTLGDMTSKATKLQNVLQIFHTSSSVSFAQVASNFETFSWVAESSENGRRENTICDFENCSRGYEERLQVVAKILRSKSQESRAPPFRHQNYSNFFCDSVTSIRGSRCRSKGEICVCVQLSIIL